MRTINGHTVLYNEKDFKRWQKKHWLLGCNAPKSYPCIADQLFDSESEAYPVYYTVEYAEKMLEALTKHKPKATNE